MQASPRYPGGFALRLASVKRYRDDKRADEADTMEAVRKLYESQRSFYRACAVAAGNDTASAICSGVRSPISKMVSRGP